MRGGPSREQVGARLAPVGLAGERIDQAELVRALGIEWATGEHHLHRRLNADGEDRTDRAAEPGVDAEADLGQSERDAFVVECDAIGAGERDFQSAAEGEAVDHRDRRAGQAFKPFQHLLAAPDQVVGLLLGVERGELLDVGARDEPALLARVQHDTRRSGLFQFGDALIELQHHAARQHVGAGVMLVEAQPGDALRVELEAPVGAGAHGRGRGCGHRVTLR